MESLRSASLGSTWRAMRTGYRGRFLEGRRSTTRVTYRSDRPRSQPEATRILTDPTATD